MTVWFFNQLFNRCHHYLVLHCRRNSFLIIDLSVDFGAFVVSALLGLDFELHPLALGEISHQLHLDAQGYVGGKATARCGWRPHDLHIDPPTLLIYGQMHICGVNNVQLLEGLRELRVTNRPDDLVDLVGEVGHVCAVQLEFVLR